MSLRQHSGRLGANLRVAHYELGINIVYLLLWALLYVPLMDVLLMGLLCLIPAAIF